jgi:hypothetical protein
MTDQSGLSLDRQLKLVSNEIVGVFDGMKFEVQTANMGQHAANSELYYAYKRIDLLTEYETFKI